MQSQGTNKDWLLDKQAHDSIHRLFVTVTVAHSTAGMFLGLVAVNPHMLAQPMSWKCAQGLLLSLILSLAVASDRAHVQ